MRLVLVSPPYVAEYMRNGRCDYLSWSHTQWYPIWLAYCGALLVKHGHSVLFIDAPAEEISLEETLKRVVEAQPKAVIVYGSTMSLDSDVCFAEQVKEKTLAQVIFAGPYVSIDPAAVLAASLSIDAVVRGEFEYPVLEIAEGKPFEEVQNLIWRRGKDSISNQMRPALTSSQLDELPFVTDFYRRHLNLKHYRVPSEWYPFVDLFTGRGCLWGHCLFCLWPHVFTKGSCYATRSVDNVLEELRWIRKSMPQVRQVFFQDDALSVPRAVELSTAMLSVGLNLPWGCYVRGNLDADTLGLMRRAGCRTLHVGYESGNDQVLKNSVKGVNRQEMSEFTSRAHSAGLRIHGDFLFGLPGDTIETIRETIAWAKELNPETAQFLIPRLYPKTPLYEYLAHNGFIKDGQPNYPLLSTAQILKLVREAYLGFYCRPAFLKKVIFEPQEYIFPRFEAIGRMIHRLVFSPRHSSNLGSSCPKKIP